MTISKCHTFLYRGVSLCPVLSSLRFCAVKLDICAIPHNNHL